MGRPNRIWVPGFPHHVTQRGNRGQETFLDDSDRLLYISLLRKYAARHGVDVLAYSLMTNHVHLILTPSEETSIPRAMHDAHSVYARTFNERYELAGHLWQDRPYAAVMDEPYLRAALRYVERNPVRAGLVDEAALYAWSSAQHHCGLRDEPLLAELPIPMDGVDWSEMLASEDPDERDRLRRQTSLGRPCGTPAFVSRVETIIERSVSPRKRGRKLGWRKPSTPRP